MPHTAYISCLMRQRLLSIAMLGACTCAHGETWVVTDQARPVVSAGNSRIIFVDAQLRLEEHLTNKLQSASTNAASIIQSYLASSEGTRFQHELIQAQQGVADAWSLGVEKIPAVVVDRRYVVYGEPDVAEAIALIDKARSTPQ